MSHYRDSRGFTLIEMAVVLVIVGILIGSFIGTLSSRIEATRYAKTKKDLEDIKLALFGYAYKSEKLPCPDTDGDGISNGVTCTAVAGFVPWKTLAVGGSDPWNNRYEYWLDGTNYSASFDFGTPSIGKVYTRVGVTKDLLAENVVAVIFSRGKNELGATGVDGKSKTAVPGSDHYDEVDNGSGDENYISRSHSDVGATNAGIFDDEVVWISEYAFKAKMVEAGILPKP